MASIDDIAPKLERRMARHALRVARLALRPHSRTLAKALKIEQRPDGIFLVIPHYWALYVHDGRNAPFTSSKGLLIWYRNPAQDPRFPGRQTPERVSQIGTLTRSDLKRASQLNAQARKRGATHLPVVFVKVVRKPTGPTNFFDNRVGMAPFIAGYRVSSKDYVRKRFRDYLKDVVKFGTVDKRSLKITIRR